MRRRELAKNHASLAARLVLFLAILATLLQSLNAALPAAARWFDGYLGAAVVLSWMLPPAWLSFALGALAIMVASLGLDGFTMALLPMLLAAYFGRRLAHALDVEFWPLQPPVALVAVLGAEALTRLLQWAAYGRAAATPLAALAVTALVIPFLWYAARLILCPKIR